MYISNNILNALGTLIYAALLSAFIIGTTTVSIIAIKHAYKEKMDKKIRNLLYVFLLGILLINIYPLNVLFNFMPDKAGYTSIVTVLSVIGVLTIVAVFVAIMLIMLLDPADDTKSQQK